MAKRGIDQIAAPVAEASRQRVLGFYGHGPSARFREFSNFFLGEPFDFTIPEFARCEACAPVVKCTFSEKAIMLTKASLMGDVTSFDKIRMSTKPAEAKALGRSVKPFDARKWEEWVEEVAFEVCRQKFSSSKALSEKLLSTGDIVIAEATRNDKIWGIGLDVGDPRVQDQSQWQGRNILGKALMRTRDFLVNELQDEVEAKRVKRAKGCDVVE
mmetsp:Transcript_53198/g.99780  ORF Transcript_53198/g.99780 Transcript_53198/m.99780 type:complete len:214 (-) Transcript_53198:18-659(-)